MTDKRESSVIDHMSYDPATKQLDVTFRKGGARWRYFGVDEDVADGLRGADSQGAYLKRHIIDCCQSKKLDDRHERF